MTDAPKSQLKKGRTRSPAYPSFDLEAAIGKVDLAYRANDRHPMAPESLASYLGSSATSSSFLQGISTLKQFGLLDDTGWGGKRRLKVSDLALDILISGEDSPTKAAAIKQAALSPAIHAEIWHKYKGNLPAKDESIRFFLLKEREEGVFNRTQVDGVIAELRSTIAFAKLSPDDKIEGAEDTDEEHQDGAARASSGRADEIFGVFGNGPFGTPKQTAVVQHATKGGKPEKKMRDLAIPLMDDEVAYLRVPSPLSEENYEYLVAQIAMFKRGLVGRPQAAQGSLSTATTASEDPNVAQVPLMITNQMRHRLNGLGVSDEKIKNLTPAEAWAILNAAKY